MNVHYFAFGSNMDSERLKARIPDARAVGRGCLSGWRFVCNKTGRDGSAKATVEPDEGSLVWGVIYLIPKASLTQLDAHEGGYARIRADVLGPGQRVINCETYASNRVSTSQLPRLWYKSHLVAGAVEHGLPDPWLTMLRALPTDNAD